MIEASTKLSEDDIDRMVKEGEANAESDKQARETVEAKNNLDSMVYQAEKMLKDNGDKIEADLKTEVEQAITDARGKLDGDLETLTAAKSAFEAKLHKLAEVIYKQTGAQPGAEATQPDAGSAGSPDDDVVDAEYEDSSK